MISSILEIVLGVFVWQYIPAHVKIGKKKKTRNNVNLVCTIVGLIFVACGAISLISCL